MKKILLSIVIVANGLNAQTPLETGLPHIELEKFQLSENVDSVWTYRYELKDNLGKLKGRELKVFNDAGKLVFDSYSYINSKEEEHTTEKTFHYEHGVLKKIESGTPNETASLEKEFVHNANHQIISQASFSYNYGKRGLLTPIVHDEIIVETTIFYFYDYKDRIEETKTKTMGKMSGNEQANKYRLYYRNEVFASVDFKNGEVEVYGTKYGTLKKTFSLEAIGETYKMLKDAVTLMKNSAALVDEREGKKIKEYADWEITDQFQFDSYTDWTKQQHLSKAYKDGVDRTFEFRKIKYKNGKSVGGVEADVEWINNQPQKILKMP